MIDQQTFLSTCKAMYKQRIGCLQENRVDLARIQRLETRLREQLFALSRMEPLDETDPAELDDAFVYLAIRFLQSNSQLQIAAAEQACEWLADDGPKAIAARDALLLFPSANTHSVIQQFYAREPVRRAILIYILTQHGVRLPKGLINKAELQDQDPYLRAHILYYAANDASSGLDVFSPYYQSLLSHAETVTEHPVLVAALWGGLVRGDAAAATALRRAIEREPDDMQRLDLLRLAALTGELEYLPIFESLTQHVPNIAYHFLALQGRYESVEVILHGLVHPHTAQYAELAWWWVSGQTLPKKPRLSIVGEGNQADDTDDNIGVVPDPQLAQQWWAKQKNDPTSRYFQGQQLCAESIQLALKQHAGMISHDLIDLLSLQYRQPVRMATHSWHDSRAQILQNMQATNPQQLSARTTTVHTA